MPLGVVVTERQKCSCGTHPPDTVPWAFSEAVHSRENYFSSRSKLSTSWASFSDYPLSHLAAPRSRFIITWWSCDGPNTIISP